MSVILVGEDNPYGDDPRFALYPHPDGSAGARFCRLVCGLPRADYIGLRRTNLCVGKWSAPAARKAADQLRLDVLPGHVLVLLGRKVAGAFGLAGSLAFSTAREADRDVYGPLDVQRLGAAGQVVRYVLLPHPSGRNTTWNEPGAFERARSLLRSAVPGVPWGSA